MRKSHTVKMQRLLHVRRTILFSIFRRAKLNAISHVFHERLSTRSTPPLSSAQLRSQYMHSASSESTVFKKSTETRDDNESHAGTLEKRPPRKSHGKHSSPCAVSALSRTNTVYKYTLRVQKKLVCGVYRTHTLWSEESDNEASRTVGSPKEG